jgi:hypothetical protein
MQEVRSDFVETVSGQQQAAAAGGQRLLALNPDVHKKSRRPKVKSNTGRGAAIGVARSSTAKGKGNFACLGVVLLLSSSLGTGRL